MSRYFLTFVVLSFLGAGFCPVLCMALSQSKQNHECCSSNKTEKNNQCFSGKIKPVSKPSYEFFKPIVFISFTRTLPCQQGNTNYKFTTCPPHEKNSYTLYLSKSALLI